MLSPSLTQNPTAPPRLLIVAGQYRPIVGGAERQAERLAEAFAQRGVEVHVLTRRIEAGHTAFEDGGRVKVHRLGFAARGGLRIRKLERLTFVIDLLRALRRFPSEPVLVQHLLYPALVVALSRRTAPSLARVSSTGSTSDFEAWGWLGVDRIFQRRFSGIAALNHESRAEAISRGYDPLRVHVIPNGVSVPALKESRAGRAPRVVFVGGLRREKRVDLLLRAWKQAGTPGELILVGDGPERNRLEAQARELGIAPRFAGPMGDPSSMLEPGDVFVLTSDAEGMSNALLEAMAEACACVATYIGGNVDCLAPGSPEPAPGGRVEGRFGWLVRRGDVPAMAAAIRDLHASSEVRSQLGKAARSRVLSDFSIDRAADRYLALFNELGAQLPARPGQE
jgi:glycosyltransferase involved in cell wall biosynthesis